MHDRNQYLVDIENNLSTAINGLKLARDCYRNIRVDRVPSGGVKGTMNDATAYINMAKNVIDILSKN